MDADAQRFTVLLGRARDGDREAVEKLVELYASELRIVASVRLGEALRPYLDSVDLAQSVHRSLLLGLRQNKFEISSPERLVGLALTILRRKIAHHWRHLRRQQRLDGLADDSADLPQLLTSISDSRAGDPGAAAAFREQVERLCARLTDKERQLIELRLQGCSTAEAARTLGLDADVLRVQLARLRKRLRQSQIFTDWL